MDNIIHDLKTERQNVSEGLPPSFKLVPVAFYVVSVATVFLSLYFYLSKKAYETSETSLRERLTQAENQQSNFLAQQEDVSSNAKRAEGIAKWLEGSRPLQPVTAVIGRSMSKESTIAELSLDRNPEIPAHTFMQLKIDGGGSQQVEATLNAIYALNFQTYSAQQVKGKNSTDFQATLIYSDR
ncbi:MAG: hypothetical protein P1U68_13505 [Verrucomicrobiales bacterium]|nr:hypothetical protein [Verrucomicrobiales bacterium]